MEGIRENGRAAFAVPLEVLFDAPRWALSANKEPYTAKAGKLEAAKVSDPSLWTTKAEAEKWLQRHRRALEAKGEVHLGLLLGGEVVEGYVLVGIDVDWKHAPKADGMPAEVALALGELLWATYTEWSLSGKGLHLLGVLPAENLPRKEAETIEVSEGVQIELYAYPTMGGRYFVWTGRKVEGSPLQLANLALFWAAALQAEEDKKPKRQLSPHAELARLVAAKEGTRHNTLKEVAAKFAARLLLTPWRSRIEEAARQTGLPEKEIQQLLDYFARKEAEWAKQRGVYVPPAPLSEAPDGLD
ncbi:MAG: hypothetical protein N3E49_09545, partial [Bacteroidia bacterium]|nr:hypothetical protein [Bacteroidia bacterium]